MSNSLRERVLLQALELIPVTGFSDTTLSTAGERAAVSKREMQDAFPQGPASLAEAFSVWADDRMVAHMAASEVPERLRDRVAATVRARIEVLVPHKEAARRAAAFLSQPQNAALAARLLMATVDAIWRAAGDRSSDFSYYTKRAMLAGVYGTTLAYWFSDSSEGHAATWTFLGHRIDNVMQIEKWRGQAREALSKLPDPLQFFKGFRGGR